MEKKAGREGRRKGGFTDILSRLAWFTQIKRAVYTVHSICFYEILCRPKVARARREALWWRTATFARMGP